MCDMTHSYVWHDSFICVTRLLCMFVMTHLMDFRNWRHWKTTCCCRFTAAWYLLFTWRGMSHVTRMNESCHMWKRVMWHPWMSRVTWHRIPTSQPREKERIHKSSSRRHTRRQQQSRTWCTTPQNTLMSWQCSVCHNILAPGVNLMKWSINLSPSHSSQSRVCMLHFF